MEDKRPERYQYFKQLVDHVGGENKFFNGDLIYPRQLEIHLPGNNRTPCVMKCLHCQGAKFEHGLGNWEVDGLRLLNDLYGAIPYHIYGGAYTEPVMNAYFPAYLGTTKSYGNWFGIHTSGSPLWELEQHNGLLHKMLQLATDDRDYISFSLDAASPKSHQLGKRTNGDLFTNIIKAIEFLATAPHRKLSVRICYLLNRWNSTEKEIEWITSFAKRVGVDSLRFSIPYAHYNQEFAKVKKYRENYEKPLEEKYEQLLKPYISNSKDERPYIFYIKPTEGFSDIELYDFNHCIYGYYQITLGADGYLYKCSAVAAPDMPHLRLGIIPDNAYDLERAILNNFKEDFDAQECCFKHGARCNRMAVECNRRYDNSLRQSGE